MSYLSKLASTLTELAPTLRSEKIAPLREEIATTLRARGYGPRITNLVEHHHYPVEVATLIVGMEVIMSAQNQNEKDKSIDPEKITTPPKESDDVREIPAVATLRAEPKKSTLDRLLEEKTGVRYDPRLAITDFNQLLRDKAIDAIDFLLTSNLASPKQVRAIHAYLFENQGAFRDFRKLHGSTLEAQNRQFEKFLRVIDPDLLNENKSWLSQVNLFGLSSDRLNWIQMQNEEVDPTLNSALLEYEKQHRSIDISQEISRFQTSSPLQFSQWIELRMNGSKTISTPTDKTQRATLNWQAADQKTRKEAATHERQGQPVTFTTVQAIHQTLTAGEEENAGQLRKKAVRSSGAVEIYPREINVKDMTSDYERWLNQQIVLCEKGEKSVILTAAQAYQRLVSIHPFDGGNGRMSRHMMDYVLERFGLPPAALGESVDDAVFGLKVKSPRQQDEFVRKVFGGVQRSYSMIHGE
ncbi:Fic family protein [Simkania negevensis]|uniref:Fido domain-containing protein n=1 Tax=Simkania negevensis (strain ATCC VR-1471 / DSM 27360 / Z) TaxID=331113 RepID=F8L8N0_SIMNZ|nr:Fic family protein [Simkania negevensis]CCB89171.1 hypothetical protein SNE_A12940 [Simkania negevensis Z]